MHRTTIAVITARADDSEQKEIIAGIAQTAFAQDADVAVFSNLYNHWTDDPVLTYENHIYDGFQPEQFQGVILTAESFRDMHVLDSLLDRIQASGIPAVMVCGTAEGFASIQSDDAADLEALTEHLLTVHGFHSIDVLTGPADNPAAQVRVEGCRRAMARHGIALGETHVICGDFWTDSGEALAAQYLRGERPMPEAVICTNDYMAFGLCDVLTAAGVRIPEELTVTGYDHTPGRIYHYPILTTYRRSRRQMGARAAAFVLGIRLPAEQPEERLILGNTCACGASSVQLNAEITGARIGQHHAVTSSMAQFTGSLTTCRTLYEYTAALQAYYPLLHGAQTLYLCLDQSWKESDPDGSAFLCCAVTGETFSDTPQTLSREALLPALTEGFDRPMLCIITPLCFQTRMLGSAVLCYDKPQSYDFSYRDWNKTVVTTLEFLRMKSDIHYLRQCQSISQFYDALTGFYRMEEFQRIIADTALETLCILSVRLGFPEDQSYRYGENYRTDLIARTANSIRACVQHHEICCRAGETAFLVLCKPEHTELFREKLAFRLYHAVEQDYGADEVLLTRSIYTGKAEPSAAEKAASQAEEHAAAALAMLQERQTLPHYPALREIRTQMRRDPKHAPPAEQHSRTLCMSIGFFRSSYKRVFSVSYAQDLIEARALLAGYLLCTTSMSVYAVAVACGYADEKYFSRQFRQCTGYSPRAYRGRFS